MTRQYSDPAADSRISVPAVIAREKLEIHGSREKPLPAARGLEAPESVLQGHTRGGGEASAPRDGAPDLPDLWQPHTDRPEHAAAERRLSAAHGSASSEGAATAATYPIVRRGPVGHAGSTPATPRVPAAPPAGAGHLAVTRPARLEEVGEVAGSEPAPESECPICPPWVVRCAHFEDLALLLLDRNNTPAQHLPCISPYTGGYLVMHFRATAVEWTTCDKCGVPKGLITGAYEERPTAHYRGDDRDAAARAFEQACAALLAAAT